VLLLPREYALVLTLDFRMPLVVTMLRLQMLLKHPTRSLLVRMDLSWLLRIISTRTYTMSYMHWIWANYEVYAAKKMVLAYSPPW
jgi:hypothetical protein